MIPFFLENSEEQGPEKRIERRQSIDMPTVEESDKKDTIEKLDDSKKAESGDDASVVSGDLGIESFIDLDFQNKAVKFVKSFF